MTLLEYFKQDNKLSTQRNPYWASILLGFNINQPYTIGNYGCLLTCISMVCNYYGKAVNPQTLNESLKQVHGFTSGSGNYVWSAISKVFSDISEQMIRTPQSLTDGQLNEIKQAINEGYPVMLQIDSQPKTAQTDMHYVLAIAFNPSDENDFTIVDPWDGAIKSLKSYLGWFRPSARKTIEQYIIYKGNKPQVTPPAPQIDLSQYILKTDHLVEMNTLKGQIDSLNAQVLALTNQLEEERKEFDVLLNQKNQLAQIVIDQTNQNGELKAQLKDAQDKNGLLVEQAQITELLKQALVKFFSLWKKNS